jgi:hypothetical protein
LNMEAMLVTSDVSKLLSVWLNTDATCRVTTQEEGVQCGARCGPGEAEELLGIRWLRRKAVCTGRRPDSGLGG